MAARLLLLGLAVAAVAVAIHALHADHRCADLKATASQVPLRQPTAVARAAADRCGDPRDRAVVALLLTARGQRPAALDLARRMTRSSPDDYLGWLIVWRLSGARDALARAQALNPRGTPAAPPR
jgi:hypothetical protein